MGGVLVRGEGGTGRMRRWGRECIEGEGSAGAGRTGAGRGAPPPGQGEGYPGWVRGWVRTKSGAIRLTKAQPQGGDV